MITYETLFRNIKFVRDNFLELGSLPRSTINRIEIEAHCLDIFPNANRLDVDKVSRDIGYSTPITIRFYDCKNSVNGCISIKTLNHEVNISANRNFLDSVSINDIDEIEYTLKYGRLNFSSSVEKALSLIPVLINKNLKRN